MFDGIMGMLPANMAENPSALIDQLPQLMPIAQGWLDMHKLEGESEAMLVATFEDGKPIARLICSTEIILPDGSTGMKFRAAQEWELLPLLDMLKTKVDGEEESPEG